jgi:hypothetical protein
MRAWKAGFAENDDEFRELLPVGEAVVVVILASGFKFNFINMPVIVRKKLVARMRSKWSRLILQRVEELRLFATVRPEDTDDPERFKAALKNLRILADSKSPELQSAEVIVGLLFAHGFTNSKGYLRSTR